MTGATSVSSRRAVHVVCLACALLLSPVRDWVLAASPLGPHAPRSDLQRRPNILFFIMDDVGIDQMKVFGYGGTTPPRTPNMDTIAHAGVRFRNTWAMPECSPSRAVFFEGRFPFRTNVLNVVTPEILANSQVSPFETTTPEVLRTKGYTSGLFGKFHLAGPDNNPFGNGVVHALGWDFFAGFLDGAPLNIDTTAGSVGAFCSGGSSPGTPCTSGDDCPGGGICGVYGCGFVPNTTDDPAHGADSGSCQFADGSCLDLSTTATEPTPGRACLNQGGIFVPNQTCQTPVPSSVTAAFVNNPNAYYVSDLVINHEDGSVEAVPFTDPRARVYRTTLESDLAINWIKQRKANKPWMATVSYSSMHAPYQQPPVSLIPPDSLDTNGYDCTESDQIRVLGNQMVEAIDHEIGRVMVEAGLATYNRNGTINYDPAATNTMVIIIGDNGTFGPSVKLPFDHDHAKGSVYQTGVWVPLIVAGPLVNAPDREVASMVNIADLFQLFGEIAGADVRKIVPKSHALDGVPMLPYLRNPKQPSLRTFNFTQTGTSITANGVLPPPCVLTSIDVCAQIFTSQQLCIDEGGVWYGAGSPVAGVPPDGFESCCDVNQFLTENGQSAVNILSDSSSAVRNDGFKFLQRQVPNCTTGQDDTVTEFYEINERAPVPRIDRPDGSTGANNLACPSDSGQNPIDCVPDPLKPTFLHLQSQLATILSSEVPCPGDGNLDKKVNGKDLVNWRIFSSVPEDANGLNSSWYDFNFDGKTDATDQQIIEQNLGTNCLKTQ